MSIDNNKIYEKFFNMKNVLYVVKNNDNDIIYPNDKGLLEKYKRIVTTRIKEDDAYYDVENKIWYRKQKKEINLDNQLVTIEFYEDITKEKEMLYNLRIDALTKLLKDRNESDKLIFEYMRYALKNKESFAIVMADIDEFKTINDTYGHACGDLVLKKVGHILLNNTRQAEDKFDHRPSDIITRVGGDEFLLLLKNITLEDTKDKIDNLQELVHNMNLNYINDTVPVDMSFGYCHINRDFNEPIGIIELKVYMDRLADEWLYINKNNKKIEKNKELHELKKKIKTSKNA